MNYWEMEREGPRPRKGATRAIAGREYPEDVHVAPEAATHNRTATPRPAPSGLDPRVAQRQQPGGARPAAVTRITAPGKLPEPPGGREPCFRKDARRAARPAQATPRPPSVPGPAAAPMRQLPSAGARPPGTVHGRSPGRIANRWRNVERIGIGGESRFISGTTPHSAPWPPRRLGSRGPVRKDSRQRPHDESRLPLSRAPCPSDRSWPRQLPGTSPL
jgi:hypothetical protein